MLWVPWVLSNVDRPSRCQASHCRAHVVRAPQDQQRHRQLLTRHPVFQVKRPESRHQTWLWSRFFSYMGLTWVHLGPPRSTWVTHGVEAVQPPPVSTGQDMPQLNVREKLTQAQKEAIVESISRLLNHSEIFHSIPAPWWIKFAELSPRSIYFLFMRISAIKKRRCGYYYLLPRRTDYVQVALNHECFVSHFCEKKVCPHTLEVKEMFKRFNQDQEAF